MTQPDKLETLLGERSLTDGGLIPRLLICHTNCQPTRITPDQQGIPNGILSAWDGLIRDLLQTYRQAPETCTIEPDPKAMKLLHDHHNLIVDRRKGDLKDITTFAARWCEQAWRISVVLHSALHGQQAHDHSLSADTALRSINLSEWFAAQQLDILSAGRWKARRDQRNEVLMLMVSLLPRHVAGEPAPITFIKARDLYQARIVKTAEEAYDLLKNMEQEAIITGRDTMPEHGGKITRIYTRKAA